MSLMILVVVSNLNDSVILRKGLLIVTEKKKKMLVGQREQNVHTGLCTNPKEEPRTEQKGLHGQK